MLEEAQILHRPDCTVLFILFLNHKWPENFAKLGGRFWITFNGSNGSNGFIRGDRGEAR